MALPLIAAVAAALPGVIKGTEMLFPKLFEKEQPDKEITSRNALITGSNVGGSSFGGSATTMTEKFRIPQPTKRTAFGSATDVLSVLAPIAGSVAGTKTPTAEDGVKESGQKRKVVSIEPIKGVAHEQGGVDVKVGGEDVEAEGGEFKVIFDDGSEAILNQEQMQRYEQGEDIEVILEEVPTMDEAKREAETNDLMSDDGQVPEQGEMPGEGVVLAQKGVIWEEPKGTIMAREGIKSPSWIDDTDKFGVYTDTAKELKKIGLSDEDVFSKITEAIRKIVISNGGNAEDLLIDNLDSEYVTSSGNKITNENIIKALELSKERDTIIENRLDPITHKSLSETLGLTLPEKRNSNLSISNQMKDATYNPLLHSLNTDPIGSTGSMGTEESFLNRTLEQLPEPRSNKIVTALPLGSKNVTLPSLEKPDSIELRDNQKTPDLKTELAETTNSSIDSIQQDIDSNYLRSLGSNALLFAIQELQNRRLNKEAQRLRPEPIGMVGQPMTTLPRVSEQHGKASQDQTFATLINNAREQGLPIERIIPMLFGSDIERLGNINKTNQQLSSQEGQMNLQAATQTAGMNQQTRNINKQLQTEWDKMIMDTMTSGKQATMTALAGTLGTIANKPMQDAAYKKWKVEMGLL
jgi:hypothetical protein